MPNEKQFENNSKQPQQAEEDEDRWAEVSRILLDHAPMEGTRGQRMRAYYDAELTVCAELEKFSKDDFELVDKDKNGYLSKDETAKAIAKPPEGVNPVMLKYVQKNMDVMEGLSKDEWSLWENDGMTQKDIAKFNRHLFLKFNDNLSWSLVKAMQKEDMAELESVMHAAYDRPEWLENIAHEVTHELPGDSCESDLEFHTSTKNINGKGVGFLDIVLDGRNLYQLSLSTDPSIATTGYKREWQGPFSSRSKWAPITPSIALDLIGDESRTNKIHIVP